MDIKNEETYGLSVYKDSMGNVFHSAPKFHEQLLETFTKMWKYLLIPGIKDNRLERRDFILNKMKSKRNFAQKLKAPLTILGLALIFLILTCGIFAPWIAPFPFSELSKKQTGSFREADAEHILGTAALGRDVYSRLIWGARSSLTVGLLSVGISVTFGVMLGIISAYQEGWIDSLFMRIVDIIMAFPGLIIVIIVVFIFEQRMDIILGVYGILGIPGYARLIRGNVLQEKTKTYVESAKVSGANDWQIMFKHIFPNSVAPIIIALSFDLGSIVLSLAGLSFLGFGDPNIIDWGYDIAIVRSMFYFAPWTVFWPGFGIFVSVLGFMLLGDGLRDALDPRIQGVN